MFRLRRDNKALLIVLTVLAFLVLISIFVISMINERENDSIRKEYEAKVSSLEKKRSELLLEYSSIEEREYAALGCSASLSMVFKGVDQALYEEIFPVFEETGGAISGIICLSPENMPGQNDKITLEQFYEMIDAGWTAAVYWEGDGELSEYLEAMKYYFECLGVPAYDTVMFWNSTYDEAYDELLKDSGVEYALQSGINIYPLIEHRYESESILIPGYIGWNNADGKGARYVYEYLLTRGGVSSFVINFPGNTHDGYIIDGTMDYTPERREGFRRLIFNNVMLAYNDGKLIVGDFDSAFEMREAFLKAKEEAAPRIEATKADLLEKIARIEEEMLDTYYEYFGR